MGCSTERQPIRPRKRDAGAAEKWRATSSTGKGKMHPAAPHGWRKISPTKQTKASDEKRVEVCYRISPWLSKPLDPVAVFGVILSPLV